MVFSCCSSGETCNIFNCTKEDLVKAGFYCNKLFDSVICCGCGWESNNCCKVTINHLNFLHKIEKPDCVMSRNISVDLNNYYKYLEAVLETRSKMAETYSTWPLHYPSIEKMVESGLYYTGSGDAATCLECGVTLESWEITDDPIEEHKKASPHCKLISLF